MNLKTEAVVFLLFAAWVGSNLDGSDAGDTPSRRSRGGSSSEREYLPIQVPDLAASLPDGARDDHFSRDLFAPPSDTAPLPPLELVLPPIEALPALLAPTAYGPGPSTAHLLSVDPVVRYVPGLFQGEEQQPSGPVDVVDTIDPANMTAGQRAARFEAFKRQYDWVVVTGGRLMFGQIRNKERYDLARLGQDVLFVEIDPETGLERFPDQQAIPLPRANVTELGLADTSANYIEITRRSFPLPLRHGDFESAREFAARCIELRNETRRGLEVAEDVYRLLVEADAGDVRGSLGLARCYELGFRFEEAFNAYQKMTDGPFKAEPQPWARLGDLLARFRLFDRAEEHYREALRVRSTHWEACWRFGRFLLERGRYEEALVHLSEAAKREPADAELRWARVAIRSDLGRCLLQLGRIGDGYERFEQARNANPSVDLGLAGMISAALFLEDVEPPALAAAGDQGPDASFDLLLALGLASLDQQEWRSSRGYMERAAAADPFRAWMAWRALSWLAEITGHPEEAYDFIERAYLSEPTDAWTLYQLGRLLARQGDAPGAMQAFKAALDLDLDFADALVGLARLHQLAGEHGAAERYYERALSVDPDRPVVYSLRGFNHFSLGEPGAAGEDFDQAVNYEDDLASARNGLAWWYYARGDSDEALTRFDYVVESRRDAPESDPHRQYAIDQRERIMEHEKKEVWTDRFDRVGSIANDWSLDESDGVVSSLRDGEVWLEGRFESSGRGRVYQVLPAERFLSLEATVTIHEAKETHVGVFVSKEQVGRSGEIRTQSKVSLRRSREGRVQATFIRKGQNEEEVLDLDDHTWPIGEPMRVRIETNGDPADTRMSLWLDELPVLENFEVQSLGRSQMPVRFGVAVEGKKGSSAKVSIDDVHIVRRK
jgi:tetratricopeptide (TPR) repeat protein